MTYDILFDIVSLVRLSICWLCLFLMFVESACGICLGCLLYKAFNEKTENCAGGVCETGPKRAIQGFHFIIILLFLGLFVSIYAGLKSIKYPERTKIIVIDK